MNQSINEILEERGSRYGSFESHARITQSLKCQMYNAPQWENLCAYQREALEMLAHKLGRILNGDPNYLDSWIDCVGYLQLVINELEGNKK